MVTGHTGFKGSWLTLVLNNLGAKVYGISLPAIQPRSLYEDARISELVFEEFIQDIRNFENLATVINKIKPDYIFHLAAQALVGQSVKDPIETISTNVMGTTNLLIIALKNTNLLGITVATTDKVYENNESGRNFKENDKLGGSDPYSASKAATEIVSRALALSSNTNKIPVTTVRAGNVIGGGDWAPHRLVPDIVRAVESKQILKIRNKNSIRPFQHVLDCLYGYLLVAQGHLSKTNVEIFETYNFGPDISMPVTELVEKFTKVLNIGLPVIEEESKIGEHIQLSLENHKAKAELNWMPYLSPEKSVTETAKWYLAYLQDIDARELMLNSLSQFKGYEDAL